MATAVSSLCPPPQVAAIGTSLFAPPHPPSHTAAPPLPTLAPLSLSQVAAGGTSSFATTTPSGQMYSWGKLKTNGDNQMYPQVRGEGKTLGCCEAGNVPPGLYVHMHPPPQPSIGPPSFLVPL